MRFLLLCTLSIAGSLMASPAQALFKVVGPDGRVTYSDRAPITDSTSARPQTFKPGHSEAQDPGLPYDLRQAAQRFPVMLYTAEECAPCDTARQFLQQRGVPFSERKLVTEDDGKALDKLGAGRTLPGLSIGSQQLRGLNTEEWTSYLDAAGYPRESRLPRGWKAPAAAPLTTPAEQPAAARSQAVTPAPRRTAAPAAPSEPSPPATGTTIRF